MTQMLTISRLGAQGDGVADTPDGPVFAPLTLPGETIAAEVVDGRATDVQILTASPERVAPVSPNYGDCGGCSLQHWASWPYLDWKRDLVIQTLARNGLETEVEPTVATPAGARRRLALHARLGQDGRVLLGFKARRSWRLVDIHACPVADPRIVAALPELREVAAPFLEHPKSAPTLHVTWALEGLDVDVTGVERRSGGLSRDAQLRAIEAAARADLARLSLAGDVLVCARTPHVTFGPATVALPPGAFLQASPPAEDAMVALTREAVQGARKIADLFCGAGAFTFPLAQLAPVVAADSWAPGIKALEAAARTTPRLKPIQAQARDLFRNPMAPYDLRGCEAIVFDPPRAGGEAQARQITQTKAAVVVGISCNPATFARDARILVEAGFRLERVTPIDQFLWSAHVELVGVFRR